MRGRDIKRYGYEWANLWLINTHNGIKGKLPRVEIEDYPAVKAHLDLFWDKISTRTDKGDTPYNLRNCAYIGDFLQQKIVWAELARTGNAFALDFSQYIVGNTAYILTVSNKDIQLLYYLLGFLNSRVILYCLNQISSKLDDNGWRWLRQFVEQLRIPKINDSGIIANLVRNTNKKNQNKISEQINKIVADIFGLNAEEQTYIDNVLTGY